MSETTTGQIRRGWIHDDIEKEMAMLRDVSMQLSDAVSNIYGEPVTMEATATDSAPEGIVGYLQFLPNDLAAVRLQIENQLDRINSAFPSRNEKKEVDRVKG